MKISAEHISRHSEDEFACRLRLLSNAGAAIIHVRTQEIVRACAATRKTILIEGHDYLEWDLVEGFTAYTIATMKDINVEGDRNIDIGNAIASIIKELEKDREKYLYIAFVNVQYWLEDNPVLIHFLERYNDALPCSKVRILLITPDTPMPDSINDLIITLPFNPPSHSELVEYLHDIVEGVVGWEGGEGSIELDEEDYDDICHVGAGMTKANFEMYAAHAIVEAATTLKHISAEDIIKGVNKGKIDIVNKNDILEIYHPEDMKDVGGMENLKEWVSKRAKCYSDEARDFGIEPPRGLVFVGIPGCLAGEAMINVCRRQKSGSYRGMRLDTLYYRFNGMHDKAVELGLLNKTHREWDLTKATKAHSLIEGEGYIGFNEIEGVVYSGKKKVYEVQTDYGAYLPVTKDHKFRTRYGYVRLCDLSVSRSILAYKKGSLLDDNSGGRNKTPAQRMMNNVGNHPNARTRCINGLEYTSHPLHRLVVEAHNNEMPLEDFLYALEEDVSLLDFLPNSMEVHHKDKDRSNNTIDNLETLTKEEHARRHMSEGGNINRYRNAPRLQKIIRIKYIGERDTYDIQMKSPSNNFVANGLIVHNSGKSLAAKSIAREFGVPLIRLDFGRMFNSFIGKSEERMRTALAMCQAVAPCCILVDEIDKGLGGIGSGGGDSGTSSRVLGYFLTWLQDNKSPIFTIVTANNIQGLPPELLRRGRFDAIFGAGLPTGRERLEVLNIHLAKRGYNPDKFSDLHKSKVVDISLGYVPAEIESAVKDGLIDAFSAGKKFSMKYVYEALQNMVPLSKTYSKEIQEMAVWIKGNATPASKIYEETTDPDNVTKIGHKRHTRIKKNK